jgi:hypothetical protein
MVKSVNSFTLPAHRTDPGYEPVVLKYTSDGLWVPLSASGTALKYKCLYYPIIQAFFDPPSESQTFDTGSNVAWSLTGVEV